MATILRLSVQVVILLVCVDQTQAGVEQWTPRDNRGEKMFDDSTLVRNLVVADMPTIGDSYKTSVRATIRSSNCKPTGETRDPVRVVRCSANGPLIGLDCGQLDIGMYVIRIIAMVDSKDIQQHRKPINVMVEIDDRPGGGASRYRHRIAYWDDFYAVTEVYFNADEARRYQARITVDRGSEADLYIHNVELHDVLADLANRAAKEKFALFSREAREYLRRSSDRAAVLREIVPKLPLDDYLKSEDGELAGKARQDRDDMLWNAIPPLNFQYIAPYEESFLINAMQPGEKSRQEFEEEYGCWKLLHGVWHEPPVIRNVKLGLECSLVDLAGGQPVPASYPIQDPLGQYYPQQGTMPSPINFMPISVVMGDWWAVSRQPLAPFHGESAGRLPYLYHALNDRRAARDAAFMLCKWAYLYPSLTENQTLGFAMMAPATEYRWDLRLKKNRFGYLRANNLLMGLVSSYEYLFDYIRGNQELAAAMQRYVPWIRDEEDVRRMIETRLLQYGAKQVIRFQRWNDKGTPAYLMRIAAVQQAPDVTRPWMESLWTNTYIYPYGNAGLPDFFATSTQRDGTTTIGSVFYTQAGTTFRSLATLSHTYCQNGGDPKYDLANLQWYRKVVSSCSFPLDCTVAGGFPLTIGDVGDPSKPRMTHEVAQFASAFRQGWRWTQDERFAWIIKHYLGREGESDDKWQAIERAAKRQGRNPFLSQSSRVLTNWAGILESGQDSVDYRFKRSLSMRVGTGYGHAHADTLDLQLVAHGVRMLGDVGWRNAYSMPMPSTTRVHNRIEVNGKNHPRRGGLWMGHSWIDTFKPLPHAQYMRGSTVPPAGYGAFPTAKSYERSVALIDVDGGYPGQVSKELYRGGLSRHDPDVVTPNSYVFDVQRISGGLWHTFCFHGTISDDFSINLSNVRPVGQASQEPITDPSDEAHYLLKFLDGDGLKYAGDTGDTLVATWRLRRGEEHIAGRMPHTGESVGLRQKNAEREMLGADYQENGLRKFTRLHLLGHGEERAMVGHLSPDVQHRQATWPFLMISQKNEEPRDSVYPAIIEPFSGEAFIESVQLLEIPENESDATAAVAVRVTTRNGHTDLCFNDPRRALRTLEDKTIAAQFAYASYDPRGLRQVQIVEGTRFETPQFSIQAATSAHQATIERVDYLQRKVYLDRVLPTHHVIGAQIELGNSEHRTSYTIVAAEQGPHGTVLEVDKAIDLSYAHVVRSDPELGIVTANLDQGSTLRGYDAGLTCTNEDMTRSWKCCALGNGRYKLMEEFSADDFPNGSIFRLWEFGERDIARLATHVYLVRVGDSVDHFRLRADVDVTLVDYPDGKKHAHEFPADEIPVEGLQVSFAPRE